MTEVSEPQGEIVAPARKPRKKANGKEIATVSEAPPATVSDGDAFLMMIERAARDPSVDIDKMERLFAMRERMHAQQAKAAYLSALAEMQPKLPAIEKRGEIKIGSGKPQKYALWEDINETIKPILAEHGFSLTHRISQTADRMTVTAVLGHREGHTEDTSISLPIEDSGSKNNVQGWGSSAQYGRRYTGVTILNLTTRGEDDDANAAGKKPTECVTEQQVAELNAMLQKTDEPAANVQIIFEHFKIDNLADLTPEQYRMTVKQLKKKLEGAA